MMELLKKEDVILSDEDLRELSEFTPYAEGAGVADFFEVAAVVSKAVSQSLDIIPDTAVKRAVFAMRAFYLLGTVHGGEVYRVQVLDKLEGEYHYSDVPFSLDDFCADSFKDDLDNMTQERMNQLCALLGLQGV